MLGSACRGVPVANLLINILKYELLKMLFNALKCILDLKYCITGCMSSEAARLKVYFREGRRKKILVPERQEKVFFFVYLKYLCIVSRITFSKIFWDKS